MTGGGCGREIGQDSTAAVGPQPPPLRRRPITFVAFTPRAVSRPQHTFVCEYTLAGAEVQCVNLATLPVSARREVFSPSWTTYVRSPGRPVGLPLRPHGRPSLSRAHFLDPGHHVVLHWRHRPVRGPPVSVSASVSDVDPQRSAADVPAAPTRAPHTSLARSTQSYDGRYLVWGGYNAPAGG